MADNSSDGFWATLLEELSGQFQSPKVGLAAADVQAHGITPNGSFVNTESAITNFMATGIDPADTNSVKAQIVQIGSDSNAFFDTQFQAAWDSNGGSTFSLPSLPSLPGLPGIPNSATILAIIAVLVVIWIFFKVVK